MGNMYTDLERSIFNHLTAGLSAAGLSSVPVLFALDDLQYPAVKQAIKIQKVYDLPNDDAPRGPGSELLTPVTGPSGHVESFDRQDWPEGYKVNYKINCCDETIEKLRELETVFRHVFRPKKPVYLYDSTTNTLTTNYCDISYRGYLNQDNIDLGFFSRATILQFEVYDYNPTVVSVPAIQAVTTEMVVGTDANATPGVDIVITP